MMSSQDKLDLARRIAEKFEGFSSVEAIGLGGSLAGGETDAHTDIDLYIYTHETIPLRKRQEFVEDLGASKADLNLTFWDLGDQWFDQTSGTEIDLIYWDPQWIGDEIVKVVDKHQASMGYTTCFWRTIRDSKALFDRNGWLDSLKRKCNIPYPPALQRAIVEKNHPVLRLVIPSYYNQVKKALDRGDLVSLNHRVAAFLASYFDILFAVNEVLHPGEKKMLKFATSHCDTLPNAFDVKINTLFKEAGANSPGVLVTLDTLTDDLEAILLAKDLI